MLSECRCYERRLSIYLRGYALLPPALFVLLARSLVLWYAKFVNISISIAVLVAGDMT